MHPEHNFEIESDYCQHDDETTSIFQSFFQQANSQQPQKSMTVNFDEIERPTDDIQGNETFQEYLETTEAQLSAGLAMPIEDAHPEELTTHQELNYHNEVNSSEAINDFVEDIFSVEYYQNQELNSGQEYECHTTAFEEETPGDQEYHDEVHG